MRLLSAFPGGSDGKESSGNVGDLGSIPGLGRSPGEGNVYPLQYSGLGNSMDYISKRFGHDWVTFTSLFMLILIKLCLYFICLYYISHTNSLWKINFEKNRKFKRGNVHQGIINISLFSSSLRHKFLLF